MLVNAYHHHFKMYFAYKYTQIFLLTESLHDISILIMYICERHWGILWLGVCSHILVNLFPYFK